MATPLDPIKLTSLSSCAGCAAKLPQSALAKILAKLPAVTHSNLLVGSDTADDAGVYRISPTLALVQTVDFFTPIVDDPYHYGQIAAANALSDVYAMGGRPLTAMNLVGMPADVLPPAVIARILRGGADKVKEARCTLVGGHTIRSPEPIYGLAVTGVVHPKMILTNANARPGDLLLLTKPLGTGIVTTAIKRGLASPALARRAVALMRMLNSPGAALAEKGLVRGATDVTGFGLMGHLASMCRASGVGAVIDSAFIPAIAPAVFDLIAQTCIPGGSRDNRKTADPLVDWGNTPESRRTLLTDAQTSGPLLLCVPPKHLKKVQSLLKALRTPAAAVIGHIRKPAGPSIEVR